MRLGYSRSEVMAAQKARIKLAQRLFCALGAIVRSLNLAELVPEEDPALFVVFQSPN